MLRVVRFSSAIFFTILCNLLLTAAEPPQKNTTPERSAALPKIAPRSAEESLQAIRLKTGFHAEIVAAEPLIRSPVAMDFDEFGRAYVVELPEYNQYASRQPHGTGSVKLLSDANGDGRFDTATVFAADLDYPTAVACWDGGILVGVAPDILFLKDTDGDGQADMRRKLFTGFGRDKAGEGQLNSFRWRIDNRFHIPCGMDGGDVLPVENSSASGTPERAPERPSARPINVRGQHLLLDPKTMTIAATSGGGQHGMSFDDWNLRGFVCENSQPVQLVMYDGRYVARNPYLEAPAAASNIAPGGKFTKLLRISGIEPWRELRTKLRSQGLIPGSDEGGAPSGFFTGATGITVYRGDAWPAEFRGQIFVGEVASNLVYRARLETQGIGLVAERADLDSEFLASTDNWFRPVQFVNAPDGTLYVLDMYRELIEGAAFLAPQILKQMDPSAGADQGRIYRIAPDGFQFRPTPRLGDFETAALVKLLEHPNAWHRETASRLLYQRQDRTAVQPLRELAATSASPLARVMALYSLQGLAALDAALVVHAMQAAESQAREQALRLAESFADSSDVCDAVIAAADDLDLRVRYQAAFTLGEFSGAPALAALRRLAVRDGMDSWMRLAILSSVGNRRGEFTAALLPDREGRQLAPVRSLLIALAAQIGAANERNDLALFVRLVEAQAADQSDASLARELVRSFVSRQPALKNLFDSKGGGRVRAMVTAILRDAETTARDDAKSPAVRAASVRTLVNADWADVAELFSELLQSRQPQVVQSAALESLARFEGLGVPPLVISAWPALTPQLRATAVETLFTRPEWIGAFLDAVERGAIARADLDLARVALLQSHSDESLRTRATKLFAGSALARRQDVVDAYQVALELNGDVDRGRLHFRKACAACHTLEGVGGSIGADLQAIRDRGTAAVLLNILDPNREVKPQFLSYMVMLDSGRTVTGMITHETANGLALRKTDNTTETILRVNIDGLKSTGMSFMPEGLETQLDAAAMADLLAYLNSIK